jgi:hypothetical protein
MDYCILLCSLCGQFKECGNWISVKKTEIGKYANDEKRA